MEFKKVIDGLSGYIESNLCPNMNELQEIGYRAAVELIYSDIGKIEEKICNNTALKVLGIVDKQGGLDLDRLSKALKKSIQDKGSVRLKIPLYGTLTFSATDIDDIYNSIVSAEK